jgi:hypothetical protein
MSSPTFTVEDFAKWNTTTSCFRLPKRLIGKDGIKEVRVALIEAIGAERVCAVQALPDHKYRIEFTSPSYKMGMTSMALISVVSILHLLRHMSNFPG